MIKVLFILLLFLALIFETALFPFPFVIITCLVFFLLDFSLEMFGIIFITTILLDSLKARPLGYTSLFLFVTLLIINIYQRGFEIKSKRFILLIALIATYFYSIFASYHYNLLIYSISSAILIFLYVLFRKAL